MFATVGMMLMASGNDLVIIFLGLEILSIATYVMAGFQTHRRSLERVVTEVLHSWFLLVSVSAVRHRARLRRNFDRRTRTGRALSGIVAGTTNIAEIASRINEAQYPALLFAGAAMMLVGFGFKIATAPFHIWTPDVYEGAPTPVTAFMAAGPKAAGFASFIRVFVFGLPFVVSATRASSGESSSGLGRNARGDGDSHDDAWQRRRDRAEQREAHAGLFVDCARRLCAGRLYRRGSGD